MSDCPFCLGSITAQRQATAERDAALAQVATLADALREANGVVQFLIDSFGGHRAHDDEHAGGRCEQCTAEQRARIHGRSWLGTPAAALAALPPTETHENGG